MRVCAGYAGGEGRRARTGRWGVCGEKGDNRSRSRFREPRGGEGPERKGISVSAGSVLPFLDRSEGKALPARRCQTAFIIISLFTVA